MSAYTEGRRARREARIPVGTPVEVLVMGGTVRATVTSIDGVMVQVRLDESGDLVYRYEDAVYDVRRRCPDDGACHHGCTVGCFRVATCSPLSASGWEDWPDDVVAANVPVEHSDPITAAIVEGGESS